MHVPKLGAAARPGMNPTQPGASPRKAVAAPASRSFIEVLGERRTQAAPALSMATAPSRPGGPRTMPVERSSSAAQKMPVEGAKGHSRVEKLLQSTLDAEKEIDAALKAAARGQTFTAAELLALQSKVFRYSQTVEVVSRGVDKLIGGLKQTLGTQV